MDANVKMGEMLAGTQFTCFTSTSTKAKILTQKFVPPPMATDIGALSLLALLVQKYTY